MPKVTRDIDTTLDSELIIRRWLQNDLATSYDKKIIEALFPESPESVIGAIRRLAAAYLAQRLVWSEKPPDKPGFWWADDGHDKYVEDIRKFHDSETLYWFDGDDWEPVEKARMKRWAGPIPEPESGQ